MSNFNNIPDDSIPLTYNIERVCQTCAHCTWDNGTKCIQPAVLGLERDDLLLHGLGIGSAYRLCNGEYWQEQEQEE